MYHSIVDYVDPKAIHLQVNAARWEDVLRLLGRRLVVSGHARLGFVESLTNQERSRPTGVRLCEDLNLALPRSDPSLVIRPCLALATLAQPVDFGSMDDPGDRVPVRLVLLVASRDRNGQLRALRRVAGLIQGGRIEPMVTAPSVIFVAASICNSCDALVAAPTTGQLADDLRLALA